MSQIRHRREGDDLDGPSAIGTVDWGHVSSFDSSPTDPSDFVFRAADRKCDSARASDWDPGEGGLGRDPEGLAQVSRGASLHVIKGMQVDAGCADGG